jgi:hypothetical protein
MEKAYFHMPYPMRWFDRRAPKSPITAEVKILDLAVFSLFITDKIPTNDKLEKTDIHAERNSAYADSNYYPLDYIIVCPKRLY